MLRVSIMFRICASMIFYVTRFFQKSVLKKNPVANIVNFYFPFHEYFIFEFHDILSKYAEALALTDTKLNYYECGEQYTIKCIFHINLLV